LVQAMGVRAEVYHANLGPSVREEVHKKFVTDQVEVIVATVAFGMGIGRTPSLPPLPFSAFSLHTTFLSIFFLLLSFFFVCLFGGAPSADKPDVRKIIHFGPPKSLEAYYQQVPPRHGLPLSPIRPGPNHFYRVPCVRVACVVSCAACVACVACVRW
jgi:superfamily II DNA/RNA helicase